MIQSSLGQVPRVDTLDETREPCCGSLGIRAARATLLRLSRETFQFRTSRVLARLTESAAARGSEENSEGLVTPGRAIVLRRVEE